MLRYVMNDEIKDTRITKSGRLVEWNPQGRIWSVDGEAYGNLGAIRFEYGELEFFPEPNMDESDKQARTYRLFRDGRVILEKNVTWDDSCQVWRVTPAHDKGGHFGTLQATLDSGYVGTDSCSRYYRVITSTRPPLDAMDETNKANRKVSYTTTLPGDKQETTILRWDEPKKVWHSSGYIYFGTLEAAMDYYPTDKTISICE